MSAHQIEGRCLCGAVTIAATPAKPHLEACHCDMCRRWGGIAFCGVQCGDQVAFSGEANIARYKSSDWAERGFCKACGTHLFYHFLPVTNYSFPAGLFDDLGDIALTEEIFVDEQPSYYAFTGEARRKTGAQIIAEAKAAGFEF